jgi:hypothetical protein
LHRLLDTFVQLFDSATVAIDEVEMQPGKVGIRVPPSALSNFVVGSRGLRPQL